ncbi:hypothetical protein [Candidatus Enterovibrio escicola]|uniref:hypothetical protein n=1 Tax=Candidatus Enterovibrio escicola TaxID=1927127 RepID=UPI0012382DC7|nr:hypothetical protein [Candidatus Enterovibrio escacola]
MESDGKYGKGYDDCDCTKPKRVQIQKDSQDKPKLEATQRGYWDKPHIERVQIKELSLWEGFKLGHQATASFTAYDFALLGTSVSQVFDPNLKPTETVEFQAFKKNESDHEIVLKIISKSLNYEHMVALIARTEVVRAAQRELAQSDMPLLYSMAGILSPEVPIFLVVALLSIKFFKAKAAYPKSIIESREKKRDELEDEEIATNTPTPKKKRRPYW